ncbi:hypothetical protein [Rhodovulum adriaticum]|uniref:Uncharacterized protein n=1 Tax=Rhodovulum adriaticum TaxID=35804 RepID=A0A4R2NJA3_RHOAD|nr:hypothetical protein [Rhodovulum adriaticum]MBK1634699.1 hypothetical protein [Rhodovulum adriaticum]TCP21593.1 hypothetical protein EV656_11060 [Rhodovulum adriaticum]
MLNYFKNVKPEDWPAVILRGAALALIVIHLFTAFFIYYHIIFVITAIVLGLLLAREMYEDLAQRFFRLKAEEYEKDLRELKEGQEAEHKHPNLLIEGRAAMRDITERKSKN